MGEIIGFFFNSARKFQGYIYDDYVPLTAMDNVTADAELIEHIIATLKVTELVYKGEFDVELTIQDKDLFEALEPEKVDGDEGNELLDLKMAMAEMVEQRDNEILELKTAIAEMVEGGAE